MPIGPPPTSFRAGPEIGGPFSTSGELADWDYGCGPSHIGCTSPCAWSPRRRATTTPATQEYWAAVRAAWDAVIARDKGVHVEGEVQTGTVTGPPLDLTRKIQDQAITTEVAIARAQTIIDAATRR